MTAGQWYQSSKVTCSPRTVLVSAARVCPHSSVDLEHLGPLPTSLITILNILNWHSSNPWNVERPHLKVISELLNISILHLYWRFLSLLSPGCIRGPWHVTTGPHGSPSPSPHNTQVTTSRATDWALFYLYSTLYTSSNSHVQAVKEEILIMWSSSFNWGPLLLRTTQQIVYK